MMGNAVQRVFGCLIAAIVTTHSVAALASETEGPTTVTPSSLVSDWRHPVKPAAAREEQEVSGLQREHLVIGLFVDNVPQDISLLVAGNRGIKVIRAVDHEFSPVLGGIDDREETQLLAAVEVLYQVGIATQLEELQPGVSRDLATGRHDSDRSGGVGAALAATEDGYGPPTRQGL